MTKNSLFQNKLVQLSILILLVSIGFYLGYQTGVNQTTRNIIQINQNTLNTLKTLPPESSAIQITHGSNWDKSKNQVVKNAPNSNITQETPKPPKSEHIVLSENTDILQALDFLLEISESDDKEDMKHFAATIDNLREMVRENPDKLQILLDHYFNEQSNSRISYYITSIISNNEIEDKNLLLGNLVDRLTNNGTNAANQKLIRLVSSTGLHQQDDKFVNAIKQVALYAQDQHENRVNALGLLMPYQFNTFEKERLVTDFTYSLQQADDQDKTYFIENIIRFSDKSDRTRIASNYLSVDNDLATRIGILSTLHMGAVQPSDSLKANLLNIANNQTDPLNEHARNALLYVFDITNDEYAQLKDKP